MDEVTIFIHPGTAEMYEHEARGIRLVDTIVARAGLLGTIPLHPDRPRVLGPHFEYASSKALFGGRSGEGLLRIALDTNIVIDYFELGEMLWFGESVVSLKPKDQDHGEDLEALQLILATWVLRDMQFVMLKQSLRDSKKRVIPTGRDHRNRKGWAEFYRARTHSSYHDDNESTGRSITPALIARALERVPAGGDRQMVRGALLEEAHVYLTRDKRVLRAQPWLRPLGLSVLTPGGLLEELSLCGALNFLWDPKSLYWPLPDQEKVAHLIWALPADES